MVGVEGADDATSDPSSVLSLQSISAFAEQKIVLFCFKEKKRRNSLTDS